MLQYSTTVPRRRPWVVTDVRGHWAQQWITNVVRAGVMDTQPNYTFQPNARVRRGDLAQTVSRVLARRGDGVVPDVVALDARAEVEHPLDLALAPRRCVMLAGNPGTRAALERAGADVVEYAGTEISVKGAGGPTCLTRPLHREPAGEGSSRARLKADTT